MDKFFRAQSTMPYLNDHIKYLSGIHYPLRILIIFLVLFRKQLCLSCHMGQDSSVKVFQNMQDREK